MTNMFTIWIPGTPTPQGSKKGFVINKRAILVDASIDNKAWRKTVTDAIKNHDQFCLIKGPIYMSIIYNMPKAKSNKTKDMIRTPDVDKLMRSTFDSVTDSGLIEDDSRVVSVSAQKVWAEEELGPGLFLAVWPKDDTP